MIAIHMVFVGLAIARVVRQLAPSAHDPAPFRNGSLRQNAAWVRA
jgi:hypothetical protein